MNTKTVEYKPLEFVVASEMDTGAVYRTELEFPIMVTPGCMTTSNEYRVSEILKRTKKFRYKDQSLIPRHVGDSLAFSSTIVTCPPKTDPEVVIGFGKNGGRKWQDKEGIHQNKPY
jgi:hypothetical protein